MGLSVVHGIVTSSRGTITVESKLGEGSVFRVYLPLLKAAGWGTNGEAAEPLPRGSERILFVDDEEVLVRLGKGLLTSLGYEVTGMTSSLEALETFRSHPDQFDLVVTDMTMPNLTGFELAQEILRLRPGLPVILCTGFSEEVIAERVKTLGLRELVMKPILSSQLATAIRRHLDQKA